MTPMLFGPAARQLFGLYHTASGADGAAAGGLAAMICPPFGHEAIRSHRFFRLLSDRLARAGVPVLRFDYFGTGDSPGADTDGELEGWRLDVCAAHEELRRRAGARRIVWIGARLGATLAVLAARSGRCDPARLVLWDPIVSGLDYVAALRERHVDTLEHAFFLPDTAWRRQLAQDPDAFTDENLGFSLSLTLQAQLRDLRAASLQLTSLHDTLVLADGEDAVVQRWCKEQLSRTAPIQLADFKHALNWTSDPRPNNAMVPPEALQRLQSAVS